MSFSLIGAVSKNRVIGKDQRLPWKIAKDLQHFYQLVAGKTVIMGSCTYYSMEKAVVNAQNIILSRNKSLIVSGCLVLNSLDAVLNKYGSSKDEVMVIGGEQIYRQFLPLANRMYLTMIDCIIDGDAYFPEWHADEWVVVDEHANIDDKYCYRFVTFSRHGGVSV